MAAIDRVAERFDAAVRLPLKPDAANEFPVHRRGLFAAAQISKRGRALLRRHAIGDAAAGAAEIEAEDEAGAFRSAAMIERINAQRTMHPDDVRWHPVEVVEAGPPDQRAIAKHPEILGGLVETGIHHGSFHTERSRIRPRLIKPCL